MPDYLPDPSNIRRAYCPLCEPGADPTREVLDVRWCEIHIPGLEGTADTTVIAQTYLSGSAEMDANTCLKYFIMFHRTEEERQSDKMRNAATRIVNGKELNSWEKSYRVRSWRLYKIPIGSFDFPPIEPNYTKFIVCNGSSKKAEELKKDPRRFYPDLEQVAAGLDKVHKTYSLERLRKNWRGNQKGSLVFMIFAGVTDEPPCVTYLVEVR
ncbi:MAG: hypothetical protein Q7R91_01035 [bacterium]|nr:hypothetical protein [bacterium]